VTLARLRRPKAICFLSYVEYRPIEIQQYYEKQVMLSIGHIRDGRVKEGS
jgi:hypothetical protein